MIYDVFQNYIVCSNKALELLEQMKQIDEAVIDKVIEEVTVNIAEANNEMLNLRSGYP